MKESGLIILLICLHFQMFSQCVQEPVYFDLDNSIDTIVLTGRCGNPLDEPDPYFLEPEKFGYFQNGNDFLIDCGFTKNCTRAAYLTVQANDTLIRIFKHEVDTGEATACAVYERFIFWFPLSAKEYFHITVNGFDTIVDGLTATKDLETGNFKIYPNPCEYELLIDVYDYPGIKTITIFNTNSTILYCDDFSTGTCKINTADMKKGIYIIQVTDKLTNEILVSEKITLN